MNILLAPDSYKHSFLSTEICDIMESSIKQINEQIGVHKFPISDGGEGLLNVFFYHDKTIEKKYYTVCDESGRKKNVIVGYSSKAKEIILEVSQIIGLVQLETGCEELRNRTTFGVGELIKCVCMDLDVETIIIGLGGTSTNDGGIGFLSALGMKLLDSNNCEIEPYLCNIEQVHQIDLSGMWTELSKLHFKLLCDVHNPLLGKEGATYVYAPQKGAKDDECLYLERCMNMWATFLNHTMNKKCHLVNGSGAAGGLGFALLSCMSTEIINGTHYILECFHFLNYLAQCDYLITGEGKTDKQTLFGKVPVSLAKVAKLYSVPTICISGAIEKISIVDVLDIGIIGLYGMAQRPMRLEDSICNAKVLLQEITQSVVCTISYNRE